MINQVREIMIGGIKQFIYVKGISYEKPILLLIHGGPGFPLIPFAEKISKLEEEFLVVYWDQRGAGKSYYENIPVETMTINNFLEDCYELIQYLKNEYRKEKIFLAGHSWGSVIGINIAHKYPKEIYAYIGISQVVDYTKGSKISYNYALKCTQERNMDEKAAKLIEIGEPPYCNQAEPLSLISACVAICGGAYHTPVDIDKIIENCKEYTSTDIDSIDKGMHFSGVNLINEIVGVDLVRENKLRYEIPIIFLCGKYDYLVPSEITIDYFDTISAPSKELIWFNESAHFLYLEESNKFVDSVIQLKRKYY